MGVDIKRAGQIIKAHASAGAKSVKNVASEGAEKVAATGARLKDKRLEKKAESMISKSNLFKGTEEEVNARLASKFPGIDPKDMAKYDPELADNIKKEVTKEKLALFETEKGAARKSGSIKGAVIGAGLGAGTGGLAGVVSGADEDDIKGMIVTGALAGGAGGALVGGAKSVRNYKKTTALLNDVDDVAKDIATGKANHAIKDGAKGLLNKVGTSAQNIADKVDTLGEKASRGVINNAVNKEFGYGLDEVRDVIRNDLVDEVINNSTRKANTLGGAAQGALIGSAGGAVIGGIAGGVDEDETVLGGALKGGFIGGSLGGIGGGVSGYFNNNAKILSNTVSNVNSLFGKNS